jgi:hypothetical protein
MMMLWRAACVALGTWSAAVAFGACAHSGTADYCGPELLRLLYVDGSGVVYVQPTTSLSPTPPGFACTPVIGTYFVLVPSSPNFKQIYAALLSARISAAPVTLVADPAYSTCTILYVTL